MPSAVGAQNLNYWATREVLKGIGSCILDTCTQSLSLSLTHPVTSPPESVPVVSQGFQNFLPPHLLLPMALQLPLAAQVRVWFDLGRGLWQLPLGSPLKYLLSAQPLPGT